MVARQVREDGDVEAAAVDAVERERVRGDLQRGRRRAVGDHLGEQLLDDGRVRRRAVGVELAARRAVADRAEKPGRAVAPREDRLEQRRRRRLAVGARDPREHQLLGRIAGEPRGQRARARRRASVDRDPGHGDAPAGAGPFARRRRRRRARIASAACVEAVGLRAADRDEEVARARRARVVRDARGPRASRAGGTDLGARKDRGELHERHGADGGGAVSSARRPRARAGVAALSARNRVWTAPGADGRAGAADPGRRRSRFPGAGRARRVGRRARAPAAPTGRARSGVRSSPVGRPPAVPGRGAARRAGTTPARVRRRRGPRLGEDRRPERAARAARRGGSRAPARRSAEKSGAATSRGVVLALRLLEDDDGDAARRVGGRESHEVRNVMPGLVSADARLLRGAGLARDREARDRRLRCRCRARRRRRGCRAIERAVASEIDAHRRGRRRPAAPAPSGRHDLRDQVRRDEPAAVGDRPP